MSAPPAIAAATGPDDIAAVRALYASLGFRETGPYDGPAHDQLRYFELSL